MKQKVVIAEVTKAGQCPHYRKGHRIRLTGFAPDSVCDRAYDVLCRDAQALRHAGKLPWQRNGVVLTRCPDCQGATWRLQLEDAALRAHGQHNAALQDLVDFSICRGMDGNCCFRLITEPQILQDIRQAVLNSAFVRRLKENGGASSHAHRRLRIGIAACPNACSLPQIKALGLVARRKPDRFLPGCSGCGACSTPCAEKAIRIEANKVAWDSHRCVGCGLCLDTCPKDLIRTHELTFELLAGGKMGRHPRLAQPLGCLHPEEAGAALGRLLDSPLLLPDAIGDWSYEIAKSVFDSVMCEA